MEMQGCPEKQIEERSLGSIIASRYHVRIRYLWSSFTKPTNKGRVTRSHLYKVNHVHFSVTHSVQQYFKSQITIDIGGTHHSYNALTLILAILESKITHN